MSSVVTAKLAVWAGASLGIAAISGVASDKIRITSLVSLRSWHCGYSRFWDESRSHFSPTKRGFHQHFRRNHIDNFMVRRNDI